MAKTSIRNLTQIALLTALLAVSAWIAIPTDPPFTLQLLAVFTAVGLFGAKKACFAIIAYTVLGIVGVPVFSAFRSGFPHFLQNGGYYIGFLLAALAAGLLLRSFGKSVPMLLLAFVVGLPICYVCHAVWLSLLADQGFRQILILYAVPFIPGDLLKVALATLLTRKLSKVIKV